MPPEDRDELQRATDGGGQYLPPSLRRARSLEVERRVCRISYETYVGYRNLATGILIGPDLILTCYHTVYDHNGAAIIDHEKLIFRFDVTKYGDDQSEKQYKLERESWPPKIESKFEAVELDDYGEIVTLLDPKPEELDFVILRIDGDASDDFFPEGARGYIDLRKSVGIRTDCPGYGFSFPEEYELMQSSAGTLKTSTVPHRFQYKIHAGRGSSGGLILDQDYKPIGLHAAAKGDVNQGISFKDILAFPGVSDLVPASSTPRPQGSTSYELANEINREIHPEDPTVKLLGFPVEQLLLGLMFILAITTAMNVVKIFTMGNGQGLLLTVNGIIFAATFVGAYLASKLLGLGFVELAKERLAWLAFLPLLLTNGFNAKAIAVPQSNLTVSFMKNDVIVKNVKGFVAVRKDNGESGHRRYRSIRNSGRAEFYVNAQKAYYFGYVDETNSGLECSNWYRLNPSDYLGETYIPKELFCGVPNESQFVENLEDIPDHSGHGSSSATTPELYSIPTTLAPFGVPNAGDVITHKAFAMGYDKDLRGSLWIAHTIDTINTQRIPRPDAFRFDPKISERDQNGNEAYIRNDYDRGSLIRHSDEAIGDDPESAKERSLEAFLYSVNVPMHKSVNRVSWLRVEDFATSLSRGTGKIHVFSGAIYRDIEENNRPFEVIGPRLAIIPKAFYKVLYRQRSDDTWHAIGFLVENKAGETSDLGDLAVSVSDIETRTGLTFFPDLPVELSYIKQNSSIAIFSGAEN